MKTDNKVECDDADTDDVLVLSESLFFSHCSASVINICLLTDTWLYLILGLILCITYSCHKI